MSSKNLLRNELSKEISLNVKERVKTKLMLVLTVGLLATSMLFSGCSNKGSKVENNGDEQGTKLRGSLEIIGSTSTQTLIETLSDKITEKNPGVKINYQGVGSSKGIKAVKDGTADIGTSSRELKEEEKGWGLEEHVIAKDGIAIAVHPENQVKGLTKEQIGKIFKGEITNWKELGGSDKKIIVLSREAGSGTRGAFEELLKIEDQVTTEALIYDGNGAMKAAIASTKDAIGYISFGYIDSSVKTLTVDNTEPNIDNMLSGKYPLSRPFIVLTSGNPEKVAKEFIDFALGQEGQDIVKQQGFIPTK